MLPVRRVSRGRRERDRRKLGVSHGTFYNYYQNKRDLLDALMVREFSAMEPALSRSVARLDARRDIEHALAQGFRNALEAVAARLPALIFVCTEAAGVDPEALQSIIQFFRFASVRSEQSVFSMIGADRINPAMDTEFLGRPSYRCWSVPSRWSSMTTGAPTVSTSTHKPSRSFCSMV